MSESQEQKPDAGPGDSNSEYIKLKVVGNVPPSLMTVGGHTTALTGAHTNNIERTWREVRSKALKYGRRKVHFPGYLAEYMFKAKYPMNQRIHAFFTAAAELYPPKH